MRIEAVLCFLLLSTILAAYVIVSTVLLGVLRSVSAGGGEVRSALTRWWFVGDAFTCERLA